MSETNETTTKPTEPTTAPVYESQAQRWLKYGSNVALTVVLVLVLMGLLIYLAQRFHKQVDMTAGNVNSLKPQTVNIIQDNKQKIRIVALYPRKKSNATDNPCPTIRSTTPPAPTMENAATPKNA